MDPIVGLTVLVSALALLQGWSMIQQKRRNNNNKTGYNPGTGLYLRPNGILEKLEEIDRHITENTAAVKAVQGRVDDCWDKLKGGRSATYTQD